MSRLRAMGAPMADVDFEREAALSTESVTRTGARGSSAGLGLLLGSLAVGAMGYAWYVQTHPSVRPANTQESFNTARMPQKLEFDAAAAAKPDNRLALAPPTPAPPPPAPTLIAAPPMVMPPDDAEARRRAEAERVRLAEEERLRKEAQARAAAALRSPMLMVDAQATAAPAAANDAGAFKVQGPNEDANRRFLDNASASDVERSRANRIDRTDALIPQGAMIRATLETAVQSDLPGMVRAITTEDVYSFDGRRILLPKSTMLTGEYRAILTRGQTRVFMVWTRALRSDGVSLSLGSYGTDALGRSGVTGEVDEHYAERFGAAIVLSIVGGASSFLTGLGQAAQSTHEHFRRSNGRAASPVAVGANGFADLRRHGEFDAEGTDDDPADDQYRSGHADHRVRKARSRLFLALRRSRQRGVAAAETPGARPSREAASPRRWTASTPPSPFPRAGLSSLRAIRPCQRTVRGARGEHPRAQDEKDKAGSRGAMGSICRPISGSPASRSAAGCKTLMSSRSWSIVPARSGSRLSAMPKWSGSRRRN